MFSLLRHRLAVSVNVAKKFDLSNSCKTTVPRNKLLLTKLSGVIFCQLGQSLSTSVLYRRLQSDDSIKDNGTETSKAVQAIGNVEAQYSPDVFLMDNDSGGHVIYASEDGVNPVLSEIRFAADAVPYMYPYIWFRDHCRCPLCVDQNGHSKVAVDELDPNIAPVLDQTNNLGPAVSILWQDGHVSRYPGRWLWAHRFGKKTSKDIVDLRNSVRWDSRYIQEAMQRFDFRGLLENDDLLFDWLMELQLHGLAVIQNVPETPEQLRSLADRVGFLRRCHFGLTRGETIHCDDGGLSFHTDLPYTSSPPGVSLVRLAELDAQFEEGATLLLSDGFHAADILRDEEKQSSEILSNVEWEYLDVGSGEQGEYHQRAKHPAIKLDGQGQVTQIVFSDAMRGPKLNIPSEFVSSAYGSLKQFVGIISRKENVFEYTLKPGEILTRDNRRVLYKWVPLDRSQSRVEGAYIDWDEVTSKIRVLYKRFTRS